MRKTYNAPKVVVNDIEAESKFALTASNSTPENDDPKNQFSKNDFSVWYDDKDEDDVETTYKVSSIWDE